MWRKIGNPGTDASARTDAAAAEREKVVFNFKFGEGKIFLCSFFMKVMDYRNWTKNSGNGPCNYERII